VSTQPISRRYHVSRPRRPVPNRTPVLVMRPLVPAFDRCGISIRPEFLYFDMLGWICPRCRIHAEAIHG
jgi:hypothetical protein